MIENGYRVYKDDKGNVAIAQIVSGMVYELTPNPEDKKLAYGYYDEDFKLVAPDEPNNDMKTRRRK